MLLQQPLVKKDIRAKQQWNLIGVTDDKEKQVITCENITKKNRK